MELLVLLIIKTENFYDQEEYDERSLAREVVSKYETCHKELILEPEDFNDNWEKIDCSSL